MSKNVLVISGDECVSEAVEISGYHVTLCRSIEEIPEQIEAELLLADSDTCVIDNIKWIAERFRIPILMIVSPENIGDSEAANDFVIKPFDPREISARINALIRRSKRSLNVITIGDMRLDNLAHRCTVSGKDVSLTPLEFKILWYLSERRGRVVTGRELFEGVWGEEYLDSSGTVMPHIARIRSKLHEPPRTPRYLKTIWGVGYKIE